MQIRRLLVLPILLVGAACASVPALPEQEAQLSITRDALQQTGQLYLWPDRLDQRMLIGALDALEQRFDRVRFEVHGNEGVLEVNGASATVPLDPKFDAAQYRETLARALQFTADHLDEPIEPDDDLEHIALRGALGSLDRFSTLFSGRGSEDFRIRFEGRLSGIGARLGRRDGDLIAVRVFPGSPASKGGLKDGDAILTIDGDPTRPLSVEEPSTASAARPRRWSRCGVERGDQPKQRLDVRITRGEVLIPSVESKKVEGVHRIGYVQVYR